MAEDFIEEIYAQADVTGMLRETAADTRAMLLQSAFQKWNGLTAKLVETAQQTAAEDRAAAEKLMAAASRASESWGDPAAFSSVVEGEVLPAYRECMKLKACIDVEDGRYRIKSSESGYLTIYDSVNSMWLHETYDPMAAAAVLAAKAYSPEMDEFHIFGVGLGYEAYAAWLQSEKSAEIFIYETDPDILKMAYAYGVLGRIDSEKLKVIDETDPLKLKEKFLKAAEKEGAGSFISMWEAKEYRKYDSGDLMQERMMSDAERWYDKRRRVNIRMNTKRADIKFDELKRSLSCDKWIVVAAGPSLDESMDFLREAAGSMRIVAIDAVLRKLLKNGIRPDIVTLGDPNETVMRYLDGIEEETKGIPLIAGRLSYHGYVSHYKGRVCVITEANSTKRYGRGDGEVWNIGGTVSSLALEAAVRMGAREVYAAGLDLAFPGGQTYAKGSGIEGTGKTEERMMTDSVDGEKVESNETFMFFKSQIEKQISRYPAVRFINLSGHGAFIKGMKKNA